MARRLRVRLRVKLPRVKVARRRRRLRRALKGGGLFKPPRHKWLARIITFESANAARRAARRLLNALKRGRLGARRIGRKLALTIARALQYAANRAKAAAKRRSLSKRERRQLLAVSKIYDRAAKQAFKIYHSKYKGG